MKRGLGRSMWEHADSPGIEGLRYLAFVDVEVPVDAFIAYIDEPRPVKRSLSEAVQAKKSLGGRELVDWLEKVHWINRRNSGVSVTALGRAVAEAADTAPGRSDDDGPDINVVIESNGHGASVPEHDEV